MPIKKMFRRPLVAIAICASLALPSMVARTMWSQVPAGSAEAKPVADRLTRPIDEASRVTLRGTVHPLARAANDRGAAPDSMKLDRIQIVLKRSDAQESTLTRLIGDLHKPGSASYHQWLTPEQFGKQFGPSDTDLAKVQTWLASHGFADIKVNPGRQTLEASASVAQFREAFHAQIRKYSVNGETHYANQADPQIPAALAPVLGGFVSLNNFSLKAHSKTFGKAAYDTKSGKARPQWTISANYGESFVMSPADFAVQYDLNPLYTNGSDGTGQTIAIINESNIDVSLVNSFRSLFGLPYNPPAIVIDGNDPGIDGNNNPDESNGASVEAYLDVEWAGAVAPKATIDLVIAGDTALSTGLILAANHAVYGNIAPVMSLSFGACEATLGSTNTYLSSLWEQAAAQGITVLVSTGDNGSAGCDNPNSVDYASSGKAVSGFASTPYNIAVGGTDFYYSSFNQGSTAIKAQLATYWDTTLSNSAATPSIKGVIPEQAWNDSQYGSNILHTTGTSTTIGAGSGGASSSGFATTTNSGTTYGPYPKPAWQTGNGVPADGARDIPDVSLFAAPGINASYFPVCEEDGDCQPASSGDSVQISAVGGTSASTPAFAGMIAIVNQKYGRQGQANFVLYPLAAQFPAAFHDVVNGTNSVPCASGSTDCISVSSPVTDSDGTLEGQIGAGTTADYDAAPGYDLATGLGTIDANVMVADWPNVKFASSATTLTPSSTTFAHSANITFSGSVTASTTPSGSVALMTDSPEPLQGGQVIFELNNGSFSGSYNALPGGTYNIWGQYSGDGVNGISTSDKTLITVTPESSMTTFQILDIISDGQSVVSSGQQVAYGTQLVLTAEPSVTTTGDYYGVPTGSVIFVDNSADLSTASLNTSGEAAYNASLPVGSHSLVASYPGDSSYGASKSSAIALTVVKDTPLLGFYSTALVGGTTYLGGGPIVFTLRVENGANYGNEEQYGVYMHSPVAPPTGTISVVGFPSSVPSNVALQSTLDLGLGAPEGVGTITAPALANGTYNVTISYSGDSNYNPIVQTLSVTIVSNALLASTTTATASANTTSTAAAVNIVATVTGQSGKVAPTGTISLASSGYTVGTATLTAGSGDVSSALLTMTSGTLLPGANTLTVQYSGDTVYQPSATTLFINNGTGPGVPSFALAGTQISITVPGQSATSTVVVAPSDGFTGNVVLTCAVTNPPGAANAPTCSPASATVIDSSSVTTALTINTTSSTPTATYTLSITGVSSGYTGVTTIPVVVTAPVVPNFTLSSGSINIAPPGGSGTSTVTVTPSGKFTGDVSLSCSVTSTNSSTLPTCSVTAPAAITGTSAVTSTLTVNTSSTTADGSYTVHITGVAGTITQSTNATVTVSGTAATPTFALSGTAIVNATPGTAATSTITITPSGGFAGAVALSCAITSAPSGAQNPPTCSVSAPPAITGTTAVTATLTVNSTAATAAASIRSTSGIFAAAGGTALASLLFFWLPIRRKAWMSLFLAVLSVFIVGSAVGCGGGSTVSAPGNPGTTAGTYTVTVTGISGSTTRTTDITVTLN